jgi:hypothetical protein
MLLGRRAMTETPEVGQGPIQQVQERFDDLTRALREADRPDLAKKLEAHEPGFSSPTRVRRAVAEVRQICAEWRTHPESLPDMPILHLGANRLEDACREALQSGVIAAAAPSSVTTARRRITIAIWTLVVGGVALVLPIALVESGVDITDVHFGRALPPVRLPRGEEIQVELGVLSEALLPGATRGVQFAPRNGCRPPWGGAACVETQPRLWEQGPLPTHEMKLSNQAYGLLFSVTGERLLGGKLGVGTMLLAATDQTPEGRYEIPLTASYRGYAPTPCGILDRVLKQCPPPRAGEGARHGGLEVPRVVVDVVPGDPSRRMGEKRLAEAKAEALRQQAAERAQQLATAIAVIETAMKELDDTMRKRRWVDARDRLDKLAALFAPLENEALGRAEGVPEAVVKAKRRFETLRERFKKFEDALFDDTFRTLNARDKAGASDADLMAAVARRHHVSAKYVEEVYTARADEIQERIQATERDRAGAAEKQQRDLERRCGTLPVDSYRMVKTYLEALHPDVEVKLGECLTPRLDSRMCWVVRCGYRFKVAATPERAPEVTKHSGEFYVEAHRVVDHVSW